MSVQVLTVHSDKHTERTRQLKRHAAVNCSTTHLMRDFHLHVSVPPFPYRRCPLQKYERITFIRKNSVACVKITFLRFRKFAVAVHPFT